MDFNKLFASFCVAGIIALLSGMLADGLYNPVVKIQGNKSQDLADASANINSQPVSEKKEEKIDIKLLLASANFEDGKKSAKKCAACHNFVKGGANKVGPNLWNILGSNKASVAGFNYSKSLSEMGGKWDYESLSAFLHNPRSYVKGTKMAFAGLRKPEELANVIEYIRKSSDNPIAKP